MLVDLVSVTTEDGLRLDGALRVPSATVSGGPNPAKQPALGVDAVLILHGTGSNFYSSRMLASLAEACLAQGAAALVVNTRGHDGISSTTAPMGLRLQGAAYELVDACCHDIAAWLDFLRAAGHSRLGLIGHSLGAVKAIYSQAQRPDASLRWLAAISPPRLSYDAFSRDARGGEFLRDYARAEELVRSGRPRELVEIRFPLPYAVSAEGFLDKYGPEGRYDVLSHIPRVTCPLVAVYGSDELNTSAAFRGMPDAISALPAGSAPRQVQLVGGADHFYSGMYSELWARVDSGLRRVAPT